MSAALGFDHDAGNVRIYGDGTNKISFVSFKDVAEAAVASLTQPVANNAVINIGGPDALSPNEVVKIFETTSGKSLNIENVSVEDLKAQQAGAPDPLSKSFSGLMLCYALGDEMPDAVKNAEALGIKLSSVQDYINAVTS